MHRQKLSIFGDEAEIQRRKERERQKERERGCRQISFYFSVAWAAMKGVLQCKLSKKAPEPEARIELSAR